MEVLILPVNKCGWWGPARASCDPAPLWKRRGRNRRGAVAECSSSPVRRSGWERRVIRAGAWRPERSACRTEAADPWESRWEGQRSRRGQGEEVEPCVYRPSRRRNREEALDPDTQHPESGIPPTLQMKLPTERN